MRDSFFTESELENLRGISKEEIAEIVGEIKEKFNCVEGGGAARVCASVNRLFHKIAGSAGVAGLDGVCELASEAEHITEPENRASDDESINRLREILRLIETHLC